MPKPVHIILMLTFVLVSTASLAAGCGASSQPADQPSAGAGSQRTAAASPSPAADATSALRAKVHAYAATMMADIKAAEDRGDVVDGVAVGQSSNPYDYVGISPAFLKIVGLGREALPAIAAEIEASNQNGLREYLLAAAGAQISGDVPGSGQSWSTGKGWARQYRENH
jgi:hypothetical protein